VYQGVVRDLGVDVVEQLSAVATAGLAPDVVVVLDVSDVVAETRRGGDADRLEREGDGFHARVRAAYRDLAAERGWMRIDADRDVEHIAREVRATIAPWLAR
jgi:dTMP kinase